MQPCKVYPSPLALYEVRTYAYAQALSHETESPALFREGLCVFHPGALWHANAVEWSEQGEALSLKLVYYLRPELTFALRIEVPEMRGELVCLNNGRSRKDNLTALAEDMRSIYTAMQLFEKLFGNNR